MISSILACTDGSSCSNVACDYAFRIAKALKTPVTGIHVLDVRLIEGPLLADLSGAIGASGYFTGFAAFRQLAEEKGSAIHQAFLDNAAQAGITPPPEFILETGHPLHLILHHHKKDSLLVVGRCGENEPFGRGLIGSTTDRLIRHATSPCLVTPAKPRPITHILAACDDTPIAPAVAITAASLAIHLNVPLTLLSVPVNMDHSETRQILLAAEVEAARHGSVTTKAIVRDGEPSDVILATATDEHCDLIVMGAHSHNRIREWFVGCTTLRVLADSAMPALLVR
jgi:nucleotide-binding universal stress UspA family protein